MRDSLLAANPGAYAYRELFVCWASTPGDDWPFDHDHPVIGTDCDWGWICNADDCTWRADESPCPEHVPSVPGLRLVECTAEPRHFVWVVDRDDYGHGCPLCWCDRTALEMAPLKAAADRRKHRWCWALNPLKRAAIRLRLVCLWSVGDPWDDSVCWHVSIRWRWTR